MRNHIRFHAAALGSLLPLWRHGEGGVGMSGGVTGAQDLLLAETLGLAMARRAADILDRHRLALTSGAADGTVDGTVDGTADGAAQADDVQFAADNAIFTAVLDAANECLGRFDARPADDRWCDALLQVIRLGQLAQFTAGDRDRPPGSPAVPEWRL